MHHSDRGVQFLAIRYPERPAEAGIEPSVGSWGDAYDNALAETVIGLFKTEVIRPGGPCRGLDDVEYAALEWVAWDNTQRFLEPLGQPPRWPPSGPRDSTSRASGQAAAVQPEMGCAPARIFAGSSSAVYPYTYV